jgi:hypothetical protein
VKSPGTKILACVFVILVIASGAYFYRVPIGAWLWHLEHETATTVGGYIVPVPANWYPHDEEAEPSYWLDSTPTTMLRSNGSKPTARYRFMFRQEQ